MFRRPSAHALLIAAAAALVPANLPAAARGMTDDVPPRAGDGRTVSSRRSGENAVAAAQDAFGVSVGRESLGLYESEDVRGFSPLAAGNARIEGLYYDPVAAPNGRLVASTVIRVGIAAQGYPFIAPTGIVDYGLRAPGAAPTASVLVSTDSWGSKAIEADAATPVNDALSVGVGAYAGRQAFGDGTHETAASHAALLHWAPAPGLDVTGFWSRSEFSDAQPSPIYLSDDGLPDLGPRRRFDGPDWAEAHLVSGLSGAIVSAQLSPRWRAAAGLFRSTSNLIAGFSSLRTDVADGSFRQLIVADPRQRTASTSGEARLTRAFETGDHRHQVHLMLRFRDRDEDFGGSAGVDLGRFRFGTPIAGARPLLTFGPQAHDGVRQWSSGVAYEGRFAGIGEVGAALVRTDYRKAVDQPGLPPTVTRARPWLLSLMGRLRVSDRLSVYGSFAEGLEESEAAPDSAVNRGAPVPALRTRQIDAGVRWQLRAGLSAVVGAFDLEKPYFTLDAADRYRRLGTIRNRGLELSLAGALTPRLDIVLGTLLQAPRVTGPAVDEGLVGERPVGLLKRVSTLNLDWRPAGLKGVSLDLSVAARGREVATADNRVAIPARAVAAVGARYRFKLGGRDALLRMIIDNLTDERGHVLRGPGAFGPLDGRLAAAYLTIDF